MEKKTVPSFKMVGWINLKDYNFLTAVAEFIKENDLKYYKFNHVIEYDECPEGCKTCLKKYIKRNKIEICGNDHQSARYNNIPVIYDSNRNKYCLMMLSYRDWGSLVYDAYDSKYKSHNDGYGYMDYYTSGRVYERPRRFHIDKTRDNTNKMRLIYRILKSILPKEI